MSANPDILPFGNVTVMTAVLHEREGLEPHKETPQYVFI